MDFIIDLNPASNSSSLIFHSAAAPASTNVSRALVLGLVFNDFGGCRFSLISTAVFITIPDNGALAPGAFNYYAHRTYMRIARVDDVSSFKYDVIRPSAQRAVICAQCAVDTWIIWFTFNNSDGGRSIAIAFNARMMRTSILINALICTHPAIWRTSVAKFAATESHAFLM